MPIAADAATAKKLDTTKSSIGGSMYHGVITVSGALSGTYSYVYSSGLFIDSVVLQILASELGAPYAQALGLLAPSIGGEITTTESFFYGEWNGVQHTWQNPTGIDGENLAWVAQNIVPGRTAGWSETDEWSADEEGNELTTEADGGIDASGTFIVNDQFSSSELRITSGSYAGSIDLYTGSGNKYVSPLVLDMTGCGVIEASGGKYLPHSSMNTDHMVAMDFFNNGFEIAMEWVGPNDGLLVAPKEDGSVDATCLFGSNGGFENGFEKLSLWDKNNDNQVSGEELAGLAVWQDANQNGRTDAGELTSVQDAGITALNLSFREFLGSYVRDGETHKMWDWWPSAIELKKVSSR
jgi:hypothetical protein